MNHLPLNLPAYGYTTSNHVVYLVDLEQPLLAMLAALADHCDEDKIFSKQDILMLAINLLTIQHNLTEAQEAMWIEVKMFCKRQIPHGTYAERVLALTLVKYAVECFLSEMHRLFNLYRFYDHNGFLNYTFGGWHGEYTPVFVPYTHISTYPQAISGVVQSEPMDRHPGKIFYPYPAPEADPDIPF